jgi:hypothetical protein
MSRTPARVTAALAITAITSVASLAGLAGPAAAQGGTPPPPSPVGIDCFNDPAIVAKTTPDIAVNYAGDAGCVGVRVTATTVRLAWVVRNPGWTSVVKSNGGTTRSRVEVLFTKTSTGQKIDFRYQLGKTVVN